MGSVPHLYTTGDNDPEIEPVQYYKHFLYCDACGSFELVPWMAPDNYQTLEAVRRHLGTAAVVAAPLLLLVPGWLHFDLFPTPTFLGWTLVGLAWILVVWGLWFRILGGSVPWRAPKSPSPFEPIAPKWQFIKTALPWLAGTILVEWIAVNLLPPAVLLGGGVILIVGLLVAREILGSKIGYRGLRCRSCNAAYAYGTPFFKDLGSNPRNLTVADVPRPLGSTPFEQGRPVEADEPAASRE